MKHIHILTVAAALCIALALSSGCRAAITYIDGAETVSVNAPGYRFSFDVKEGVWNADWPDGKPFVRRAYAEWEIKPADGGPAAVIASTEAAKREKRLYPFIDPWGGGQALDVSFDNATPSVRFVYSFRFYEDLPYFTVRCTVENKSASAVKASGATPFKVNIENGGGAFFGPDPASAWVLENGHKYYLDFFVRIVRGNEATNSNWDSAFHDPSTNRSAVFGFVTVEHSTISVLSFFDAAKSISDSVSGWKAFSGIRAENGYNPAKPVKAFKSLDSETLAVIPDMKSYHRALEAFGDAVAAHNPVRKWKDPIPTGWNSWATGYDKPLDQNTMLANARFVHDNLLQYGMTTFQIDDGWEITEGDWEPSKNFNNGMKWFADHVRGLDLKPGIWIMPFCLKGNSQTAKDHPDWLAPKSKFGKVMMPKELEILDVTNPEVQRWMHDLFVKISKEWGFKVIKIDFIYYLLLADRYSDPDATNMDAYRLAHRIVREAIGDDAFLLEVGVPVYGAMGYADAMRLALDTTPSWGDDEGYGTQGTKPLVRNLARRYYLNHRVWINHPDCFYLGAPDEPGRWRGEQLKLNEARTYATLVALNGGITKIGNRFFDLNEQQLDILRRVLPVYDGAARPVDLFENLYPLVWDLDVAAGGMDWHAVGVFNWGRNRNWGKVVTEAEQTVAVRGADLGLDPAADYLAWAFWGENFIGEFKGSGSVNMQLAPRTDEVLAIHKKTGAPQFLSTNRHVTQGGTDIAASKWDDSTNTLEITQRIDPNYPYSLFVYVPRGYMAESATAGDLPAPFKQDGNVVRVEYKTPNSGLKLWTVKFAKK